MTQIRLPWPDKKLSPNSRLDRRYKTNVRANARTAGWAITREADAPAMSGPVHLNMVFRAPDKRRRDLDNAFASCKYHIDGISQALKVDDHLFSYTIAWGDPVPGGAVDVTISQPVERVVQVPIRGVIS